MANISTELNIINTNVYGENVRDSIISASYKLNLDVQTSGLSGLYRGNNLGSGATFAAASTEDQRTAISSGTFEGLFIGDYWTINNIAYRIADFNYWRKTGNSDLAINHLVLVPNDGKFGKVKMNSSAITTGAYIGSDMYTTSLESVRTQLNTDFGSYLLSHKRYFPNATVDGAQSAGAWYDSTVDLMNEIMVFGAHIMCKSFNDSYVFSSEKDQLALFKYHSSFIANSNYPYWLLDVASSNSFCSVNSDGSSNKTTSNNTSTYIRPVIAVKG